MQFFKRILRKFLEEFHSIFKRISQFFNKSYVTSERISHNNFKKFHTVLRELIQFFKKFYLIF